MENLHMFIHSTDDEKILERLYKEPDETIMSGGMLNYEEYLKLPATDEYLNNKERLQRLDDERKGIFKVLSRETKVSPTTPSFKNGGS
jgi:spore coat polysaccharide biosynthesis predicted glycosyltransferase SpsG